MRNRGAVDHEVDSVRARYLTAVLAGRQHQAFDVLEAALAAGIPLYTVYVGVVQAALYTIGERWERAEVTIAEEHLATAVVQSNLAILAGRLRELNPVPAEPVHRRVVVTVSPGEQHAVGARILADCLDAAGWRVEYLPPPVAEAFLLDHLTATRPDVVALSTALPVHLPRLGLTVKAIRSLPYPPVVALGGSVLAHRPRLAAGFGADVTAVDAAVAVDVLRTAVRDRPRVPRPC